MFPKKYYAAIAATKDAIDTLIWEQEFSDEEVINDATRFIRDGKRDQLTLRAAVAAVLETGCFWNGGFCQPPTRDALLTLFRAARNKVSKHKAITVKVDGEKCYL